MGSQPAGPGTGRTTRRPNDCRNDGGNQNPFHDLPVVSHRRLSSDLRLAQRCQEFKPNFHAELFMSFHVGLVQPDTEDHALRGPELLLE